MGNSTAVRLGWGEYTWGEWVYIRLRHRGREWKEPRARNQGVWILAILLSLLGLGFPTCKMRGSEY